MPIGKATLARLGPANQRDWLRGDAPATDRMRVTAYQHPVVLEP